MMIKIAVFGSEEIMERLHACTAGEPDIELVPFVYTGTDETAALLERASTCDIYIFTEVQSFLSVRPFIEKKRLPAIQIACDNYTVLTSLFYAKHRMQDNFSRLSIDVWHRHNISEVIEQLKNENHKVYTHYYGDDITSVEALTDFHKKLWNEGKIDHVLTSVQEVEDQLKALDIPVSYMTIPDISLKQTIIQAKSAMTFNHNAVQLVAGHIQIKNIDVSKQDNEKIVQHLHNELKQFAEQTDASVTKAENGAYILFGTQKLLNYITRNYRDFPLLKLIRNTLTVPVSIGFGLGLTAGQADKNAQRALEKCNQTEESNCYIVNERQDTIGPLGVRKHFDTGRLYQALIHKARLNNELSYNFIDFITHRNNEPFSSNDIATYYQVTKRSAERTINKLLSGEVIKAVGEEKPYIKGRPRKLFQITVE